MIVSIFIFHFEFLEKRISVEFEDLDMSLQGFYTSLKRYRRSWYFRFRQTKGTVKFSIYPKHLFNAKETF